MIVGPQDIAIALFQSVHGWAGSHHIQGGLPGRTTLRPGKTAREDAHIVLAEHTLNLAKGVHGPSHARAWVSASISQLPRSTVDDVLLVVSELVTNAVRHGRPEVVVSLQLAPHCIRIAVRDAGESLPVVNRGAPASDQSSGRGLLIVAATASDWGVTPVDGQPGKIVWAELQP